MHRDWNADVIGFCLRVQIVYTADSVDRRLERKTPTWFIAGIKVRVPLSTRRHDRRRICVCSLATESTSLFRIDSILREYPVSNQRHFVRSLAAAKWTRSDDKNTTIIFGAKISWFAAELHHLSRDSWHTALLTPRMSRIRSAINFLGVSFVDLARLTKFTCLTWLRFDQSHRLYT